MGVLGGWAFSYGRGTPVLLSLSPPWLKGTGLRHLKDPIPTSLGEAGHFRNRDRVVWQIKPLSDHKLTLTDKLLVSIRAGQQLAVEREVECVRV